MQIFKLTIHFIDFYYIEEEKEMAFKYIYDHIPTTTPNNRRPGLKLEPTSITIHNTGNPASTARNERKWLTNTTNTRTASYHIVIDEHEAIEVIPLDEVAWHAGDGSSAGSGNRTSIGIEVCESGNYEATIKNTIELVAKMLHERNWGVNQLKRHYDWSKKNCPRIMNQDGKWTGWTQFINRVQLKLNELKNASNGIKDDDTRSDSEETEEYQMNAEDANKIIKFLSAAYFATSNAEARKEFNRLANELRKASGQQTM